MATCRFQGCEAVDVSEVLPLGWTLVLFETRRPPALDEGYGEGYGDRSHTDKGNDVGVEPGFAIPRAIQIERHRTVLCPDHAIHVAQLCGLLPPAACAEPAASGYVTFD
ncbi:MAG TPA: hypothetical protein VIU64_00450 [Polyangia bacterium]